SMTFSLLGFAMVRRDGIELFGTFVATVNEQLRVGAVQDTGTVSAETPVADVQSTKSQETLSNGVINSIPSGRRYFRLAALARPPACKEVISRRRFAMRVCAHPINSSQPGTSTERLEVQSRKIDSGSTGPRGIREIAGTFPCGETRMPAT